GIVEDFTDITGRKRAEEASTRSEEQLRALFDSAADIVFTKDRQGRYMRVNSACARLHGISEEEFLGKTDFDLFPEEQAKHSADIDRQVLVEGRTFTGEYDRQVKGKPLTFSVVKTPLYGHDGAIIGLCGIARDITEQESLEEQFRQAQKMEALGTLAGGVAHDFNNLLGGILGYVGLIKGDYSPEEKHYAMLELVEKAGVRAAELTNQLLAFSRKGKYELRPVSLNNSVEDVLKLIGRTLDKSIEIATELQEKLPSVEGDPGQLEQAILNMCVNAAEAMPGGGKLQLETRVVALGEEFARKYLGSDPGDYVLLSVSDTGIGMDSETLSRMFEPFFTTKEVGKGTGLGLSTVYGIVKNHGGYVDVRSQPGKGSTFDIYLPVSKKQFTPPRPRAAELQTGHETILAVDDEEIIRSLLEETLQKLGYKVILANDGEEAVQIYEERKDEIDAVIIDMIMPHLGGGETFREIRRRNPDVRVLLASGYSQDGAAQRILDEGVRGFIQKPFELVELSQKLRQVLD
ncbi:MAG: PAS domain-containing sensor histidine kinase, partial [Candidatus Zixiibacteriota bacterium]